MTAHKAPDCAFLQIAEDKWQLGLAKLTRAGTSTVLHAQTCLGVSASAYLIKIHKLDIVALQEVNVGYLQALQGLMHALGDIVG